MALGHNNRLIAQISVNWKAYSLSYFHSFEFSLTKGNISLWNGSGWVCGDICLMGNWNYIYSLYLRPCTVNFICSFLILTHYFTDYGRRSCHCKWNNPSTKRMTHTCNVKIVQWKLKRRSTCFFFVSFLFCSLRCEITLNPLTSQTFTFKLIARKDWNLVVKRF